MRALYGGFTHGASRTHTKGTHNVGSSGVCVGCCLGEDSNLAAPLAQSLFFLPGERRPPRGRCRHTMAVGVLVPPDATRVVACVATVYTNAPKPRREARSSHLCTLLRSQGHPQPKLASQQCTQMPQNGAESPFSPICVHSCVTTAARATGRGHRSIGIQAVLRGRGAPWCPSWPGPFSCPWRVEPLYRVQGSDDRAVCRTGAVRSGAFACLLVIEHGKRRG